MSSGIKVTTTGKGEKHYERYLRQTHKRELVRYMQRHEYKPKTQRRLVTIYDVLVTTDNIIYIYTHTMPELIQGLRAWNVSRLEVYSSVRLGLIK